MENKGNAKQVMKRDGSAHQAEIEVSDIVHRSTKFWAPVIGVCERTLQDAIRRGKVGHVRLRGQVLLKRGHVEAWLASQRT